MDKQEIIKLWKSGLSKEQLAILFKREHNRQVRIYRMDMKHRHDGNYLSNYQALEKIEKVLYQYLKRKTNR